MNYGGKCACCGLDKEKYLQLDHINDDGAEHKKQINANKSINGHYVVCMYKWAVKNNYPSNLQLLCANCHQAKTVKKPCTHEDHESFKFYVASNL
jgi:5-methylcytosine-specific restriction endonuclease McrA